MAHLSTNPMPTPKKKKDLLGKVIETEADAIDAIKSGYVTSYVFGSITLFLGLAQPSLFVSGILLFILAFFLQKKHSRIAAILLLALACLEVYSRVAAGTHGLIAPLIFLWFSLKGVQGTFALHTFRAKNPPLPPSPSVQEA